MSDDQSHHGPKARDRRKMTEVERLSRVLVNAWAGGDAGFDRIAMSVQREYRDVVRAVLRALREPTLEMCHAAMMTAVRENKGQSPDDPQQGDNSARVGVSPVFDGQPAEQQRQEHRGSTGRDDGCAAPQPPLSQEQPERFCYSCSHPLIQVRDDLAIEIQDQIQASYKQPDIFSQLVRAEQASWRGRFRLSAKHLRISMSHALSGARLLVIPAESYSSSSADPMEGAEGQSTEDGG